VEVHNSLSQAFELLSPLPGQAERSQKVLYVNKYYEKNLTTGEVTTYYYLGDRLVAQRKGTTVSYIHEDHLTGTSVTSDSNGAQTSTIKYLPYGETRSSSGTIPTDKRFTGQRLDGATLYYYGARYYDPTIGRFISADTLVLNPANPQSLNRYSYALNNPLRYVDPTGHIEINWGTNIYTGQPNLPPPEAFGPGGYYGPMTGSDSTGGPVLNAYPPTLVLDASNSNSGTFTVSQGIIPSSSTFAKVFNVFWMVISAWAVQSNYWPTDSPRSTGMDTPTTVVQVDIYVAVYHDSEGNTYVTAYVHSSAQVPLAASASWTCTNHSGGSMPLRMTTPTSPQLVPAQGQSCWFGSGPTSLIPNYSAPRLQSMSVSVGVDILRMGRGIESAPIYAIPSSITVQLK
jgi:RHS repeat-associated protein